MFRKSGCWHIDYPITFFHLFRAQILESSFPAGLLCSCIPQSICKCIHLHFKTCTLVSTFSISYAGAVLVSCLSHRSSPERLSVFTLWFIHHPATSLILWRQSQLRPFSCNLEIAPPLIQNETQGSWNSPWAQPGCVCSLWSHLPTLPLLYFSHSISLLLLELGSLPLPSGCSVYNFLHLGYTSCQ